MIYYQKNLQIQKMKESKNKKNNNKDTEKQKAKWQIKSFFTSNYREICRMDFFKSD